MRDALEASVAEDCPPSTPPLRTHSSQASTVASAGARAASASPRSKIQRILVAEKYGSSTRPVVSRTGVVAPRSASSLTPIGRTSVLPDDRSREAARLSPGRSRPWSLAGS